MCSTFNKGLLVILSLAVTSSDAWASKSASTMIFSFNGNSVSFNDYPEKRLMLSSSCTQGTSKFTCLAYKAIRFVRMDNDPSAPTSLANPSAHLCKQVGGSIVIGTDAQGNENSFCKFNDGSMLDNGSLFFYAKENNEKASD